MDIEAKFVSNRLDFKSFLYHHHEAIPRIPEQPSAHTAPEGGGRGEARSPQPERVTDPVANPDRARLEAFLTPGVVSGTVEWETTMGSYEIDFDTRDEPGNPSKYFYPKDQIVFDNSLYSSRHQSDLSQRQLGE